MNIVKSTIPFSITLLLLILMSSCEKKHTNITTSQLALTPTNQWITKMTLWRDSINSSPQDSVGIRIRGMHDEMMSDHTILYDWWLQDSPISIDWYKRPFAGEIVSRIIKINPMEDSVALLRIGVNELASKYIVMCSERRAKRLKNLTADSSRIAYMKYHTLRPSFFAYTEGASDARHECNYIGGGSVNQVRVTENGVFNDLILSDTIGAFRDPDVDFDGKHMLFAWKKSPKEDDFHIYEMNMDDYSVRQITNDEKIADIEPIYLPDNNILFNSTRCGTSVDCWFTEVSNMYVCDKEGKYIRRIGFDQVHTPNPRLLSDGRVVYTRWDYNDRGQVYTQPLFQMNYDGTGQSEYYGLNSWFPTTVTHVREIPGTRKIMATILGHHNPQHGKLGIIDLEAGRDENEGVTLVAPIRKPNNDRIDSWGQYTDQFQHPFPLNKSDFLISYTPLGYHLGHPMRFGIYWMNIDGEREVLAYDKDIACCMPVLVAERTKPFVRSSNIDWSNPKGSYYMQDIYAGNGLKGIKRGDVKKLRVVELEFRAAGVGQSFGAGEGGSSHASSPVGVGNASWDLKKVLGTVDVYEDGSAFFEVPARTPIYFQALDSNNYVIQTMRSWSTLQGGEMQSCVGCHEHKNSVPLHSHPVSIAMDKGVQQIEPMSNGGGVRYIGFIDDIQPLLDRECISCHDGVKQKMSLTGETKVMDAQSKRKFSNAYINLTHARRLLNDPWNTSMAGDDMHPELNWISGMSKPSLLEPYFAGAATSNIIKRLKGGHGGNKLTKDELDLFAMWIDLLVPYVTDYKQANNWSDEDVKYYDYYNKKKEDYKKKDIENVKLYVESLNK